GRGPPMPTRGQETSPAPRARRSTAATSSLITAAREGEDERRTRDEPTNRRLAYSGPDVITRWPGHNATASYHGTRSPGQDEDAVAMGVPTACRTRTGRLG